MRATGSVSLRNVWFSFWPWMRPFGSRKLPLRRPSGNFTRKFWSSCLRRNVSSARGGRSLNASCQSSVLTMRSMSSAEESGRIQAADDGAHAGARDRIDRHVHLVEHFEHADMGRAARAAAESTSPMRGRLGGMRAGGSCATGAGSVGAAAGWVGAFGVASAFERSSGGGCGIWMGRGGTGCGGRCS